MRDLLDVPHSHHGSKKAFINSAHSRMKRAASFTGRICVLERIEAEITAGGGHMTADEVKEALGLVEHPREGGWFSQTYASGTMLPAVDFARSAEPAEYNGPRRIATAIYYLLQAGSFSEFHRLKSDEVFHHYAGGAVELFLLHGIGEVRRVVLGRDLAAGQRPQAVVPRGMWQGARLLQTHGEENEWALMGCTVSPGFEYDDYETATKEELLSRWPQQEDLVRTLTRHGHW